MRERSRLPRRLCHAGRAALEASLHGMCFLYPENVKQTLIHQRKRFRRKRSKALDFTFKELIDIADELGWFPPKEVTWGKRTTLAGFAHELRKLRNYVHPGVWAPEQPTTMKFTKATYRVVYEISTIARSWLLHRIHESLRKRIMK